MNKKQNKGTNRFFYFFKNLGAGLITGVSDDDPSGIATYSQAGAQFGLITLWTALITFPLMIAIQEMCARIGLVTQSGLTGNLKKHYPVWSIIIILVMTLPALILNISADIAGMGAVANMLFPTIPAFLYSIFFTFILIITLTLLSYKKIVSLLKYLCLSILGYLIIPFLLKPNWIEIFKHTLIPTIHFNKEYLSVLVAILGTTISPYLFFWQATMEAERKKNQVNKKHLVDMKKDVTFGMLISNSVMYFIILTTGITLFQNGIQHIETVEEAAKALEPLVGEYASLLFSLGIIGTGFLAIPTLCGSFSYILATLFNWPSGFNKKYYQAKHFYLLITISLLISLGINYIQLSPIKALFYTAVLYGLTAPILILLILLIANNKKIMGQYRNGILSNIGGIITLTLMSISAVLLIYFMV